MTHEKRCAGQRPGAECSMPRRRVLTTVSRSGAFPDCGAVSESNEASWLLNVHAYAGGTPDRSPVRNHSVLFLRQSNMAEGPDGIGGGA